MAKKIDLNAIRKEIVAGKMERYGIDNEEMAIALRVSISKWFSLKKDLSGLELHQVEKLEKVLKLDQEELFRFVTGINFDVAFKNKALSLGLNSLAR